MNVHELFSKWLISISDWMMQFGQKCQKTTEKTTQTLSDIFNYGQFSDVFLLGPIFWHFLTLVNFLSFWISGQFSDIFVFCPFFENFVHWSIFWHFLLWSIFWNFVIWLSLWHFFPDQFSDIFIIWPILWHFFLINFLKFFSWSVFWHFISEFPCQINELFSKW